MRARMLVRSSGSSWSSAARCRRRDSSWGPRSSGYGYDVGGNLAEQSNLDGSVLKGVYDGDDRLTGLSVGDKAWGFSYDAGGRRTRTDLPGQRCGRPRPGSAR